MPLIERGQSMRWITRLVVFVLSACVGASTWYILAQKKAAPIQINQSVEETPAAQTTVEDIAEAQQDAPFQSIKFGAVEPLSGYANVKTIILRESPDAGAPIVASC